MHIERKCIIVNNTLYFMVNRMFANNSSAVERRCGVEITAADWQTVDQYRSIVLVPSHSIQILYTKNL